VVLIVDILQKGVERARFHAMQSRLREIPEGLPELFKTIILRDDEHKEEFVLLSAMAPLRLATNDTSGMVLRDDGGCRRRS
jgi:hypothetical protein